MIQLGGICLDDRTLCFAELVFFTQKVRCDAL